MKIRIITALVGGLLLTACGTGQQGVRQASRQPIEIVYDNDVHCAMGGYAKMAFLRDSLRTTTPFVTTVSAGDFMQGGMVGATSRGAWVIDVMNHVGYDLAVPGNHEFDFGGHQFFTLMDSLKATVLGSNFIDTRTGNPVFAPYVIKDYGQRRIAFVGVLTTVSGALNSGKEYVEPNGQFRYSFDPANIFRDVQTSVDKARREGANYVVVISHLGDVKRVDGNTSSNMIARTSGIDAVIDGHAHHVLSGMLVKNRKGEDVLLTSSGTKFGYVGRLTLDPAGHFTSRLHPIGAISGDNAELRLHTDSLQRLISLAGNEHVGSTDVELAIQAPDGHWLVRMEETTIGDFITDAFRTKTNTDIALMTAGSIRSGIKKGDVKHMDVFSVMPFFNYLTVVEMTGEDISNALEFAYHRHDLSNTVFMEMSGLSCVVDTTIASPCKMTAAGELDYVGEGARRVSNIRVLDKQGEWQPIDLQKTYRVAAIEYLSFNHGCFNVLKHSKLTDEILPNEIYAVDCVEEYIRENLTGRIDERYAHPQQRIVFK